MVAHQGALLSDDVMGCETIDKLESCVSCRYDSVQPMIQIPPLCCQMS